ncbi:hypothetical protein MLD38_012212 [Melastoma candidum]|uniref:Uncharacterized protein n=1 Tax=Melastoma candidum TaxID=119954 RepID=A0ACB9R6X5_9MYRT|nr:hypothetical protein MLD38_012212 [Melastoma candidum]
MCHLSSSRRLLSHIHLTPTVSSPTPTDNHDYTSGGNDTFDSNVIMVLAVLLCAVVCSLVLNSLIRCMWRCLTWLLLDYPEGEGSSPQPSADRGVEKKALNMFPVVGYSPELDMPGIDAECVICLSEFCPGDRVRLLPRCHHGFHPRCIDKWLSLHSSCPTCRQSLLETQQKIISGYDDNISHTGSGSELTRTIQATVVPIQAVISTLEPEGLVCQ